MRLKDGKSGRINTILRTLAAALLALSVATVSAQSRTDARVLEQETQRGIVELYEALTPLKSVGSFMTIGAHPDDERSSQIALLSRGMGVRSITVTANRGEGGQNSIGTEYLQALGVLRSREMEQSSAAFNVELFFLSESFDDPIFDFRFSKSAVETLEIWGQDVVMEKLVRAIRQSRPDIIFTNFQDVFGQHGNHRAMAWAGEQAFSLAADPDAFPEHAELGLEPWQAAKFYLPSGRGSGQADFELDTTLSMDTGAYNQIFGATYEQLGQQSRAYHRSQDMGSWANERAGSSNLHLVQSFVTDTETDDALFAGLPFTVGDLAANVSDETLAAQLNEIQDAIDGALAAFPDFTAVQESLETALSTTRAARETLAGLDLDASVASDLDYRLGKKELELQFASRQALSLVTRIIAATPELTRGGSTEVTVSAYLGGGKNIDNVSFSVVTPEGWTVESTGEAVEAASLSYGQTASATFLVTVPEDAPYYNPYIRNVNPFLAYGDVYGVISYEADGVPFEVTVDSREIIGVLPDISLRVTPDNLVYNTLQPDADLSLNVAATNYVNGATETTIIVDAPEGWTVEPASADLSFNRKGDARGVTFTLVPPADISEGSFDFAVRAEGASSSEDYTRIINYDHVGKTYLISPATVNLQALEVAFDPSLRVGYVAGGSDLVYESLRLIGMNVDLLSEDDLTTGDLSKYDSIAVGIYTYRLRPDLLASNERLLKWVEDGGNLLVQYHRNADAWDAETVPPYPIELGRVSLLSRVTAADGPVEFLEPENPIMTTPNALSGADFDGWTKERGLYFAEAWDEHYTPLFSVTDAQWPDTWDELPFLGSMLTTEIGEGRYTYTSLVLHTQIENNVPGAYRIYANLLTPPSAVDSE